MQSRLTPKGSSGPKSDANWSRKLTSSADVWDRIDGNGRIRVLVYKPDEQASSVQPLAAQDLHDHAGQFIAGLFLRLNMLGRHVSSDAGRSQIEHMRAQLNRLEDELDRLYEASRPAALECGLTAAISALLSDWKRIGGFNVSFDCNLPEIRLSEDVELALYRVAQEAITNIVKHAPLVQNIEVTLRCSERDWELLTIADDGPGFDAGRNLAGFASEGKRGLAGMRVRLCAIGGDLEILSYPDLGTTIVARRNPAMANSQP